MDQNTDSLNKHEIDECEREANRPGSDAVDIIIAEIIDTPERLVEIIPNMTEYELNAIAHILGSFAHNSTMYDCLFDKEGSLYAVAECEI